MDNIWNILEEEAIFVPQDLKLILKATKYDSFFALERFTQSDQKKIEKFMQTTLHEIIKEDEREKYYGIFKNHPEKFIFVGGLEQSILEIINVVKKIAIKNKKAKNLVSVSASGSSTTTENNIINLNTVLERNVNKYIQENFPDQVLPQISATVIEDGLGSHVAILQCPFPKCEKLTKISRNGTRWNTSNFYKHFSVHSVKQDANKSLTITGIDTMFINKVQEKRNNEEEVDIKPNFKRKKDSDTCDSYSDDDDQIKSEELKRIENFNSFEWVTFKNESIP
ncbi:uncharacterized protein LOC127281598 [Leptopilina boulardi]|uniref:uncharacterized protein LOC127281598 n=1 Tax=Leptopilina boulardi TaxID=63433 RepID=UPI0021F5D607|nr:uncharacterized protein LOC127281598 [Leptopilina boulardi]